MELNSTASQHPRPRLEIITSWLIQGSGCSEVVAAKFSEAEGIAYYSKAAGKTLAYLVLPTGNFVKNSRNNALTSPSC